ncbi:MAG TPA: hypothetical protein VHS78_15655 [Candidatus Elarobacter sp.]|nr:hypothetical protein [Candidatus Elarobacter sp.]
MKHESRSYSYHRRQLRSEPTLPFAVFAPDGSRSVPGRGVLDTGATWSVVPRRLLEELRLQPVRVVPVKDSQGGRRPVEAYDVLFAIPRHFCAPIRVLSTELAEPLIGRDVMDTLRVTFDGPMKMLEVEPVI